ncbi:MAG: hypothetical protein AVDCRST_MAG04-2661, partial [uncultured Acetobacteraceae bacterium]
WTRRRGAGRACGPSAWRSSRTRLGRAKARPGARRRSPRCASSC